MTTHLTHLRVDHFDAPLALAPGSPRFGWWLVDDSGRRVAARRHRVVVHVDTGDSTRLVGDTGPRRGGGGIAETVPGLTTEPGVDYRWHVEVELDDDTVVTADGEFGVGPRPGPAGAGAWPAPWVEPAQTPVLVEGPTALGPEAFAAAARSAAPMERLHPPRLLRHVFTLHERPVRARLRVTSQGVHHASVNGSPAADDVLAPGYVDYHRVLPVVTRDITTLLTPGENVVGLVLGDGWWAGRISALGRSAQYGDRLRATWQVEVRYADGEVEIVVPDETVRSSRGPIDYSDIFIGERYDARAVVPGWDRPGFDDSAWTPSTLTAVDTPLTPYVGEPIRRVREWEVTDVLTTPAGDTVLDLGQVIAGRVRVRLNGAQGAVVRLEHGEVLDERGEYVDNIVGINKDQIDEYVLGGDGDEEWEPLFTFHGFRYVRLTLPDGVELLGATAVVIGDDLSLSAGFASSDARIDRLVENTVWSQRSNFLAVPTDCPQRERVGWTGDLQVFAPTATTLMEVGAFLERWLADVRAAQAARDGLVPIIVPMPPAMSVGGALPSDRDEGLFDIDGAAGWGDAITIVPWELYRHEADVRILADNIDAMRAWTDYQRRQAREVLPARLRGAQLDDTTRRRHEVLWNGRLNFGDWLAPSTLRSADNEFAAIMTAPRLTHEIVGPCFQARSLDLLALAEETLGGPGAQSRADSARSEATLVRAAFAAEYISAESRLTVDLQGPHVLALAFDMIPPEQRDAIVARLVELVHEAGDHLDTGFLSVPHLLDVLWDHGHVDLARTLILQDTAPSWLYEVKMGATTIWETWEAVHPDGTVERTSMNHYAFGCVVDVLYRRIAGIDLVEPGYRVSRISPDLDGFLDHCAAHVDTPHGRLAVDWERDGIAARLVVDVPIGTHARLDTGRWVAPDSPATPLSPGRHTLQLHRT